MYKLNNFNYAIEICPTWKQGRGFEIPPLTPWARGLAALNLKLPTSILRMEDPQAPEADTPGWGPAVDALTSPLRDSHV